MDRGRFHGRRRAARMVLPVFALFGSAFANAAQPDFDVDLPAQPLSVSLRALALQSGLSIIVDDRLARQLNGQAVHGHFALQQALTMLLSGSGLVAMRVGDGFVINRAPADKNDNGIVVTGTRIRGAVPVGSELITIDRSDIEKSGYATTQQIIDALPQNFGGGAGEVTANYTGRNLAGDNLTNGAGINLRGLGNNSTLTLVDGNRPAIGGIGGQFVDVSLIPTSVIDRIEILPDGASAIYGSDAVAGVVNLRLRQQMQGAETQFHVGFADGFKEVQASQVAGLNWSSGHLIAAYEYYHRGRLAADDRDYATENLTRFGGPDLRTSYANPATITAADGSIYGVPAGQNGSGLTAASLIPGVANLSDGRANSDLLPRMNRNTAYLGLEQSVTDWLSFSGQAFFADRKSTNRTPPLNSPITVSPGNAYYVDPIGTLQPILVDYDFTPDLGALTQRAQARSWTGDGSLTADLGAWKGELHGSYSLDREKLLYVNLPNYVRLAAALADTNTATAYDLLGDGSFTNPTTIAAVRGSSLSISSSHIWSTSLKFDGPLFQLPAGSVRMAFGGEFRKERYSSDTIDDYYHATPTNGGDYGLDDSRTVIASYAEFLVPIIDASMRVPGVEKLDLSLAGRVEHYSDFGTTGNPRLGLSWKPIATLTLRATYGTSFRAPTFDDTRVGPQLNEVAPYPIPDPSSPTGTTNVLALFGNNPTVGPERARIWTVGFDARPKLLEGFAVSATYFHINYRARIENLADNFFSFLTDKNAYAAVLEANPSPAAVAALYADPTFQNPYNIPASAILYIADARNENVASQIVRGLDFDVAFRRKSESRSYELGMSGTYLMAIKQKVTNSASFTSILGTIGNPVDLRLRGRALGSWGRASASAFLNFTDGYRNTTVAPNAHVKSWTTVDLQLSYALLQDRSLKLAFNITNMFNRNPPYVEDTTLVSASGFDPEQASPIGRLVGIQLTKSW